MSVGGTAEVEATVDGGREGMRLSVLPPPVGAGVTTRFAAVELPWRGGRRESGACRELARPAIL